tara:strand:- start:267 stop:644 length:378 start_codon:yes stop_codon:yes gene_type:complete
MKVVQWVINPQGEPEEKIEDVLCDLCKKSCKVSLNQVLGETLASEGIALQDVPQGGEELLNFSHATLSAYWGFGSRYDTQAHECHICESCYDGLSFRPQIRVVESEFPEDELEPEIYRSPKKHSL